jgi:hypothetical protein
MCLISILSTGGYRNIPVLFQAGYFTVKDPRGFGRSFGTPSPEATFSICARSWWQSTHSGEKMVSRPGLWQVISSGCDCSKCATTASDWVCTNIHLVQSAAEGFPVQQADGVLPMRRVRAWSFCAKKPDIRCRRTQESIVVLTRCRNMLAGALKG